MSKRELERLADLLLKLYEQSTTGPALRDHISIVRFEVNQMIDGD